MNDQACTDIGRNIAAKLQELLQREVDIAKHVLGHHEISFVMLKLAASFSGGVIMAAMQNRNGQADPGPVFDEFANAIRLGMDAVKPDYLAALAKIEDARQGTAR